MQAHNNTIEEFLGAPKTVFVVPVYQRNYDWQNDNCKLLFNDIVGIVQSGREHFLGTICFKVASSHERSIIDGQQRLTSITLMLKAIYDYDADQEEILQMMLRWWAVYMNDIRLGRYAPSARMEQSLRNVFAQSADRSYFFETIPNYGNPLGLSSRGAPLASKVQNLLIGDFLNYMALRHDTYLSTWDDDVKKKFVNRQQR